MPQKFQQLMASVLHTQVAEWFENVCTSICLVTIFMSIVTGERQWALKCSNLLEEQASQERCATVDA